MSTPGSNNHQHNSFGTTPTAVGWSRSLRRIRGRIRSTPVVAQLWKAAVFITGLVLVGIGVLLVVLPGPFTIPPVLAGFWLWASEFHWAQKRYNVLQRKAAPQLARLRRHRVATAVFGLLSVAVTILVAWFLRAG